LEIEAMIANPASAPADLGATVSALRRAQPARALVVMTAGVLVILVLAAIFGSKYFHSNSLGANGAGRVTPPLVMMMDSPNPALVYDEETIAANGTNADVISDILADLPVRKQKETVGPEWRRDEDVLKFRPDLIIIHFSAFDPRRGFTPKDRFKVLVKFLADTPTKLLIYSRRPGGPLREQVDSILEDLYAEHPGLKQRIYTFSVSDYGPQHWRDRVTGSQLKLMVKDILKLQ
jgi:hypothetical protein